MAFMLVYLIIVLERTRDNEPIKKNNTGISQDKLQKKMKKKK